MKDFQRKNAVRNQRHATVAISTEAHFPHGGGRRWASAMAPVHQIGMLATTRRSSNPGPTYGKAGTGRR
jgi:hypothetical protein